MGHAWFDGFWDFIGWLFFDEQVEEEQEEEARRHQSDREDQENFNKNNE